MICHILLHNKTRVITSFVGSKRSSYWNDVAMDMFSTFELNVDLPI
jgi:hypothetical protein